VFSDEQRKGIFIVKAQESSRLTAYIIWHLQWIP